MKTLHKFNITAPTQDRAHHCQTWYRRVTSDGEKIHSLIAENLELFQVSP